ncbi:hypothetical protein MTO96_013698 [Rhipicephalus appendiculatus]
MFDAEGPTVGSKRKNPSGAPASDAGNNTRESKRPRSSAKKVDVLEEMIDKLADKTERMFEMLLTRLNESDAERNAQHATVNTQLLAVNKRIEDLERREVQLQQPWRADVPPSVTNVPTILNREPYDHAKLPGYVTHSPLSDRTGRDIKMRVLVRRGIAFVEHELNVASDIDGTLIEIIPSKGKTAGLYLLNVYSTPSKKGLTHPFDGLFREAMGKASSKPLLICGDFNAPHTHWGYGSDSPKGRRLAELVDDLGLTLLNEPASHTSIGQGACRETTPDLSMCVNADDVSWANTFEDLGSDHRILSVVVGRIVEEQASNRKVRIVEWDKFRKTRDREKKEGPIEDIGAWCKKILADVEKATKEIEWTDWKEKEAGG